MAAPDLKPQRYKDERPAELFMPIHQWSRTHGAGWIYDLVRLVVKKNKFYCVRGTYREGDKGGRARSFVRSLQVF